jgi:hypothetical protein
VKARGVAALVAIAACGGRTGLRDTPIEGGVIAIDASIDAAHEAATDGHVEIDSGGSCSYDDDPSPSAVQSYGACGEGVNIASLPTTNCAGLGAAFEYVPETDVVIERIELWTDAATIGLLDVILRAIVRVRFCSSRQLTREAWRSSGAVRR